MHNAHPGVVNRQLQVVLMNRLAAILPPAQVQAGVDATSKKRAFEEAGLLFENLHGLSRALVTDSLFARERLGSTGLGHGVAIPHGRIKGLKAPMAAMFALSNPIGFDAPDEQPVNLLIFFARSRSGNAKAFRNSLGNCRTTQRCHTARAPQSCAKRRTFAQPRGAVAIGHHSAAAGRLNFSTLTIA